MDNGPLLRIDGEVERPAALAYTDLERLGASQPLVDVNQVDARRQGQALPLNSLLELVRPKPSAAYLGLHSQRDDFHASIPLDAVRQRALVIYRLGEQPLPVEAGGPVRFFIPDHAECHTDEIDECANVKFIDHIELTAAKGFDNRPHDEASHDALHENEG